MHNSNAEKLHRFGIDYSQGGAHFARTLMFEELSQLLSYIDDNDASKETYQVAVERDNCLGKRSVSTRKITTSKLTILYGLDPNLATFRALRYLWNRDESARPLIALLCAISRDRILRLSVPFTLSLQQGEGMDKEKLEEHINTFETDRFTKATLESTVRNLCSTWRQSGHVTGRLKKYRTLVTATLGAVTYALFLSFLNGHRGKAMFETDYIKLLDCNFEQALELAEAASRRGWIVMKRVGDVIEVTFPNFLTRQELGWLYEQN